MAAASSSRIEKTYGNCWLYCSVYLYNYKTYATLANASRGGYPISSAIAGTDGVEVPKGTMLQAVSYHTLKNGVGETLESVSLEVKNTVGRLSYGMCVTEHQHFQSIGRPDMTGNERFLL